MRTISILANVHALKMDNAQCIPSCVATTLNVEVHALGSNYAKCTQKNR
jgi:hypothetical protein